MATSPKDLTDANAARARLTRAVLDSIWSGACRYVLSDSLDSAWAFGSVGLGETTAWALDDQHAEVLCGLLINGWCVLGREVDFVSTETRASTDTADGVQYHKDLRVHGRIVELAVQ